MSKLTTYNLLITGLAVMVILNLGLIATLWILPPDGPHPPGERQSEMRVQRFLERDLNLSQDQQDRLRELRRSHLDQTAPLRREIRTMRTRTLPLIQSGDTTRIDSLTRRLGRLHTLLERHNMRHLQNIRNELDPEQRDRFDRILEESARRQRSAPVRRGAGRTG